MNKKTQYMGFWLRFIAYSIDSLIIGAVAFLVCFLLLYTSLSLVKIFLINLLFVWFLLDAIYEIYLTHKYGGTVGKILMKCKVIDLNSNYLTLKQSTIRYFSKILSALILCIGYIMIGFTPKKQGFHDELAKTYVINNPKIRISDNVKKLLIILTVGLIVSYLVYQTFSVILTMINTVYVMQNKLDSQDPIKSLNENCNQNWTFARDRCVFSYVIIDKTVLMQNTSLNLELCNQLKNQDFRTNCISRVAVSQNNKNLCSIINKSQEYRICNKLYDFYFGIKTFFDSEKNLIFDDSVKVQHVEVGLDFDDYYVQSTDKYYQNDVVYFTFFNISGLTVGSDKNVMFNMNVKIYDENGVFIRSTYDLLDTEKYELEDTKIPEKTIVSKLRFKPGKYTYEFTLYDDLSKKASRINKTIRVLGNETRGSLTVREVVVGDFISRDCIRKNNAVFSQQDILCLMPVNLEGFQKGTDGMNWLDVDIKTIDETGNIVYYEKNIYRENGRINLRDNTQDKVYITVDLKTMAEGKYNETIVIHDRISGKEILVTKSFFIVNTTNKQELISDGVIVGIDIGWDCILQKDLIFLKNADYYNICFKPINVAGFELADDGSHWFEMELIITNKTGAVVDHYGNIFGKTGKTFLKDNTLTEYYVSVPSSYYNSGDYFFNLFVYDLIGKTKAQFNGTFSLVTNDDPTVKIDSPGAIVYRLKANWSFHAQIQDKKYDIKVLEIRENPFIAKFEVNGFTFFLENNKYFILSDGTELGVMHFFTYSNELGITIPVVEFYLLRR